MNDRAVIDQPAPAEEHPATARATVTATATVTDAATRTWTPVCPAGRLLPDTGVAALVNGKQLAVFRTWDDRYYTVGNHDPYSGANIMSRAIVGNRGEVTTVAAPMYKQVFDLTTGQALDDPEVSLGSWQTRVRDGLVEVLA